MKRLTLLGLFLFAVAASASPSFYGFAGGAFIQGPNTGITVPSVIGETTTAAGTTLTNAGLTSGTVSSTCSDSSSGLIVSQNPAAGRDVASGTAVDMVTSTGSVCPRVRKHRFSFGFGFGRGL